MQDNLKQKRAFVQLERLMQVKFKVGSGASWVGAVGAVEVEIDGWCVWI